MAFFLSNDGSVPDVLCGCTVALRRTDSLNEWLSVAVIQAPPGAVVALPFPHTCSDSVPRPTSVVARGPELHGETGQPLFVRPPETAPDTLFAALATFTPPSHAAEAQAAVEAAARAAHMRMEDNEVRVHPSYAALLTAQAQRPWPGTQVARLAALREAYADNGHGFVLLRVPVNDDFVARNSPVLVSWSWLSGRRPSSAGLLAAAVARSWWFLNEEVANKDVTYNYARGDAAFAADHCAVVEALRHYCRYTPVLINGHIVGGSCNCWWEDLPARITHVAARFANSSGALAATGAASTLARRATSALTRWVTHMLHCRFV